MEIPSKYSFKQIMFFWDFVRIVGSLINAFRPALLSDSAGDLEIVKENAWKKNSLLIRDMFINDSG